MRHVDIDQGAVAHDLALGRVDETHAAHVGGQLIDFVDLPAGNRQRGLAVSRFAEVQLQELIGGGGGKLVLLDVHPADPIPLALQFLDQVAADEATRTTDHRFLHDLPQPKSMKAPENQYTQPPEAPTRRPLSARRV